MAKVVMALVPHPDDAEYHAGGLLARRILDGDQVIIVIATDGQKGSYELDVETLIATRREEAVRAARVLGAETPIFLGYPDFELDQLPGGRLRGDFIRLIRKYKPDVVVTEDPFVPNEYHPDHRAVAWAASEASQYASLPLIHPEHIREGLEIHLVAEKYYYAESTAGANRVIDISETMDRKLAALGEHGSQITFLVEGILRQARQAGLDLTSLLGDVADNPMAAFTYAIQAQAAEVGRAAGYQYGEAYRYVRYHPLVENYLSE